MIEPGNFVVFKNPMPDEIWNGEPLRYKILEIDKGMALLEAVTPALHIRPTYRANVSELERIHEE